MVIMISKTHARTSSFVCPSMFSVFLDEVVQHPRQRWTYVLKANVKDLLLKVNATQNLECWSANVAIFPMCSLVIDIILLHIVFSISQWQIMLWCDFSRMMSGKAQWLTALCVQGAGSRFFVCYSDKWNLLLFKKVYICGCPNTKGT